MFRPPYDSWCNTIPYGSLQSSGPYGQQRARNSEDSPWLAILRYLAYRASLAFVSCGLHRLACLHRDQSTQHNQILRLYWV